MGVESTSRTMHATNPQLAAPDKAIIRVAAKPWGDVVIDGIARGQTPIEVMVTEGDHEVIVSYPARLPSRKRFRVTVRRGERKEVLALFPADGTQDSSND